MVEVNMRMNMVFRRIPASVLCIPAGVSHPFHRISLHRCSAATYTVFSSEHRHDNLLFPSV